MSRLGQTPILIPKGVELKESKCKLTVKGPKGTLEVVLPEGIAVIVEENLATIKYTPSISLLKPMHGLYRSLINNSIVGVSIGHEKNLKLIGVGYRAVQSGDELNIQLGFSHPSQVKIPVGITVQIEKSTAIKVTGIDKQLVGQFAANVRALRPPEPYKGKGIRYVDEYVRKKAGKAAKGK